MPKYSVHIPEQTILVDGDKLDGQPLAYWAEHGRSLIMWDPDHGAFANAEYEIQGVSD
jgi:hypothetical protein